MIARPVVDLPQPDSPTRPSVSPGSTSSDIPDTAWTFSPVRPTGNSTTRSSTRSSASPSPRRWALPVPAISRLLLRLRRTSAPASDVAPRRASRGTRGSRPDTSTRRCARASRPRRAAAPRRGSARARRGSGARSGSPCGGLTRSGGRPPMTGRRVWLRFSSFGMLSSSASVYGIFMLANSARGRRLLDELAAVHHRDHVGVPGDDAEVVGDEDDRHVAVLALLLDQVEDLRLHRHVERRGRLVGEQHRRAAGERDGDHHALAHAARQLVRVLR